MVIFLCLASLLFLVLGLPLIGLWIVGRAFPTDLTLFPLPIQPGSASIAWPIWGFLAVLISATLAPPIWRWWKFQSLSEFSISHPMRFPWWGWMAGFWVLSAWILAWTRFSWFATWQPHTFPLLWFGYIVLLNAWTYHRAGQCVLLDHPRLHGQLFVFSAGFWWTFEYLNQFVKNWHYVNVPEAPVQEYALYTSLAFSTVLPAVLSTYEWLATFLGLSKPFANWHPFPWIESSFTGWLCLVLGCVGLSMIGLWPTVLFPLLWICPLAITLGAGLLVKRKGVWSQIAQGDWRPIILSALAALLCGFWWELWNAYSLVHWEYTIPYVHALTIFEMPVLGYAGYLPFGVLCVEITAVGLGYRTNRPLIRVSQTSRDNAQ